MCVISQEAYLTNFIGSGVNGFSEDRLPLKTALSRPCGLDLAPDGTLFWAEQGNNVIRSMKDGVVKLVAGVPSEAGGFADGAALQALFKGPVSLCGASSGVLYISDTDNHRIRALRDGVVVTLVPTGVWMPSGLAVDAEGTIYFAERGRHLILALRNGKISVFAGEGQGFADGPAVHAKFNIPVGVTIGKDDALYICEYGNNRIRRIKDSAVETFAGSGKPGKRDGLALEAELCSPTKACFDKRGNTMYVADYGNNCIRMIKDGVVSTITAYGVAKKTPGVGVQLVEPISLFSVNEGLLLVSDRATHKIISIRIPVQSEDLKFSAGRSANPDLAVKIGGLDTSLHKCLVELRCPNLMSATISGTVDPRAMDAIVNLIYNEAAAPSDESNSQIVDVLVRYTTS
jgi:DNA-binding beta-propeller fold protein YncE